MFLRFFNLEKRKTIACPKPVPKLFSVISLVNVNKLTSYFNDLFLSFFAGIEQKSTITSTSN